MEKLYWDVYPGQWVLPMEKFPEQGKARAVPIADGVTGKVLKRELRSRYSDLAESPLPENRAVAAFMTRPFEGAAA